MRVHRIWVLALLAAALPAIAQAQKTTYDFDKSAPFRPVQELHDEGGHADQERPGRQAHRRGHRGAARREGVRQERQPRPTSWSCSTWRSTSRRTSRRTAQDRCTADTATGGAAAGGRRRPTCASGRSWSARSPSTWSTRRTKQMAWRGLGTKEIDTNAKPEKRDSNITKAVEKIFKNYPPKVKT